jgi:hypothetical protein
VAMDLQETQDKRKFYNLITACLLFAIIGCCSSPIILVNIKEYSDRLRRERYFNTFVSTESMNRLCNNHILEQNSSVCSGTVKITYNDIPDIIDKSVENIDSYQEVKALLQPFLYYECELVKHPSPHHQCIYQIDEYNFRLVYTQEFELLYPQSWLTGEW